MPGGGTLEAKAGRDSTATACPVFPQVQEVQPITSYDAAGSFLLLGCNNGSIYYVGEQRLAPRCLRASPRKRERRAEARPP